jgi:ribose transport system permease protein
MNSLNISTAKSEVVGRRPRFRMLYLLHSQPLILPSVLFVVLFVSMVWLMGEAFSVSLLTSILQTTLPLVIIGLGQTLVILTGGIDLAVGGIMSLSTAIIATQMTGDGDILVWLPVVLLIGFAIGLLNGYTIVQTGIQPFIVTLATWSIFSGVALRVLPTQGGAVAPLLITFAFSSVAGVNTALWLTLGFLLLWIVIRRTRFGIAVYAIGSNKTAAELNGLRTGRTEMLVYGLSGLFASCAGVYFAALTDSGSSIAGDPFILRSVAAVVIGGTSLAGGRGGFTGTVLGALILSFITVIIFFAGAESAYSQLFQGVLLVVAVIVYSSVMILVEQFGSEEGRD